MNSDLHHSSLHHSYITQVWASWLDQVNIQTRNNVHLSRKIQREQILDFFQV